jgi:PAS domain S-box-containing protein
MIILVKMMAIVMLVELSIMLLFENVLKTTLSGHQLALFDVFLLAIIATPLIYFLALKRYVEAERLAVHDLELYKEAIDQHSIVAITDTKGTILDVNELFCDISGYSKEELVGNNHRILNSGNQSKKYWQNMYRTIGQGHIWNDEVLNKAKDGHLYWVDTTIVPVYNVNNKLSNYIAIRTDITERKELEASKKATAKRLEELRLAEAASRAKSEVLAKMSHELRIPLNAILGFSQLLEVSDTITEDDKESVVEIKQAGEHLLVLVNQVLDLSELDAGKIQLDRQAINLHELIKGTITKTREMHPDSCLDFENSIPATTIVMADPVRLKQVILNLLLTIDRNNTENSTLTLSAKHTQSAEVIDIALTKTNCGLSDSALTDLQNMMNGTDVESYNSLGIGIEFTIAIRLINLMNAQISLTRTNENESTFRLALPLE